MAALILVDFNSIEKTIKYMFHVKESITNLEIIRPIIVDNADKKQYSLTVLKRELGSFRVKKIKGYDVYFFYKLDMEILYIWSGENLGYAKGNNLGTEIIDQVYDEDYYIVSNNDLRFKTTLNWECILDIYKENPAVCVIGPQIVKPTGQRQSPNKLQSAKMRLIGYYWLALKPFKYPSDIDYTDESKICYRVNGSFMILRASQFREVERFDPKTFMYAEEIILSERLKKIGGQVYFYNETVLIHEHGATVNKNSSIVRAENWCFDSLVYCYKRYFDTPNYVINISKIGFTVYKIRRVIRFNIKKLLKK